MRIARSMVTPSNLPAVIRGNLRDGMGMAVLLLGATIGLFEGKSRGKGRT